MRTFRVYPFAFAPSFYDLETAGIESAGSVLQDGTATSKPVSNMTARDYLASLGVNLADPPGKSVFFNDRSGYLFVKATKQDMDTIERALALLNQTPPQIHITARFILAPQLPNALGLDWYLGQFRPGILPDPNFRALLHEFHSRPDTEFLGEPGATVISGRQTQMKVENGPLVTVIPYVLADGYTINLAIVSITTESGSNQPFSFVSNDKRKPLEESDFDFIHPSADHLPLPPGVQPVDTANVWDNQTLGCVLRDSIDSGKAVPYPAEDRKLLLLITATIVDRAGRRVHTDDEMPFAQKGVPRQPPSYASPANW